MFWIHYSKRVQEVQTEAAQDVTGLPLQSCLNRHFRIHPFVYHEGYKSRTSHGTSICSQSKRNTCAIPSCSMVSQNPLHQLKRSILKHSPIVQGRKCTMSPAWGRCQARPHWGGVMALYPTRTLMKLSSPCDFRQRAPLPWMPYPGSFLKIQRLLQFQCLFLSRRYTGFRIDFEPNGMNSAARYRRHL